MFLPWKDEVNAGHFDLAGTWTSHKKCHFFCRNSIHRKVFQLQLLGKKPVLPLWEISSKMLDNLPIKLSHLYLTSRDVWLSSSTCGHCYAYHLICIWNWKPQQVTLRVVPHLSSGIVEWMRMKITPCEERRHSLGRGKFSLFLATHCVSPFSCGVIFMDTCVWLALLFWGKMEDYS